MQLGEGGALQGSSIHGPVPSLARYALSSWSTATQHTSACVGGAGACQHTQQELVWAMEECWSPQGRDLLNVVLIWSWPWHSLVLVLSWSQT